MSSDAMATEPPVRREVEAQGNASRTDSATPGEWSRLPGRLVVVSGPSGAGKTTLVDRVLGAGDRRICRSISATTRAPRPGEHDGVDYLFLSRAAFEAARDGGEFLEWAEVHGQLYGTPIGPARRLVETGHCVILVIDVQGGLQVHARVPSAALVWIEPPGLDSLAVRLRQRGANSEADVTLRLRNAEEETAIARLSYPRENWIRNDDGREDDAARRLRELLLSLCPGGPTGHAR